MIRYLLSIVSLLGGQELDIDHDGLIGTNFSRKSILAIGIQSISNDESFTAELEHGDTEVEAEKMAVYEVILR